MVKHFLSVTDFVRDEIEGIFTLAADLKSRNRRQEPYQPLRGKTLAMIFQKPSSRTRVSFEVGIYQLGGHALHLPAAELQLGVREMVRDVARVLARYCDGVMARLFSHQDLEELARFSTRPVINGLTDALHPCQVLTDLFTILEHRNTLEDLHVAFVGDGNNLANSWLNAATVIPMTLSVATPKEYEPDPKYLEQARSAGVSTIHLGHDPEQAVATADVIYTDVWFSMGHEHERHQRLEQFQPFQVNAALVAKAPAHAVILHCLPAHRGEEISAEVIESERSLVFDQAENRLHVQKAIMFHLLG